MGECYSGGCHRFSDMNWKMREGTKEGWKRKVTKAMAQRGAKCHSRIRSSPRTSPNITIST
jgi:hypothetical protein